MIPPQAVNIVARPLAILAARGVGRLVVAATDGTIRRELERLTRADEPTVLMEIARRARAAGSADSTQIRARVARARAAGAAAVAGYLAGDLTGALVSPMAVLVVKRGMQALCGSAPVFTLGTSVS